jgi:hypothetical protein
MLLRDWEFSDAARSRMEADRLTSDALPSTLGKTVGDRERAEILAAVRKGILKSAYLHTNIFNVLAY